MVPFAFRVCFCVQCKLYIAQGDVSGKRHCDEAAAVMYIYGVYMCIFLHIYATSGIWEQSIGY